MTQGHSDIFLQRAYSHARTLYDTDRQSRYAIDVHISRTREVSKSRLN